MIAGAGPAGLAVAQRVSAAGYRVCIIDPDPLAAWPNNYGVWVDEFQVGSKLRLQPCAPPYSCYPGMLSVSARHALTDGARNDNSVNMPCGGSSTRDCDRTARCWKARPWCLPCTGDGPGRLP